MFFLLLSAARAGDYPYEVIAATGMVIDGHTIDSVDAPRIAPGSTWFSDGDSRTVVFCAQHNDHTWGLYSSTDGVTRLLVAEGDEAPGGGTFGSLSAYDLAPSGSPAFLASVGGATSLWLMEADVPVEVVHQPAGAWIHSDFQVNGNDQVLYQTCSAITCASDKRSLWLTDVGGDARLLLSVEEEVEGHLVSSIEGAWLNDDGRVTVSAKTRRSGTGTPGGFVASYVDGALNLYTASGDAVSGANPDYVVGSIAIESTEESGEVVGSLSLEDERFSVQDTWTVAGIPGNVSRIAQTGASAGGYTYDYGYGFIRNNGRFVFSCYLSDVHMGICASEDGSSIDVLAVDGATVAGTQVAMVDSTMLDVDYDGDAVFAVLGPSYNTILLMEDDREVKEVIRTGDSLELPSGQEVAVTALSFYDSTRGPDDHLVAGDQLTFTAYFGAGTSSAILGVNTTGSRPNVALSVSSDDDEHAILHVENLGPGATTSLQFHVSGGDEVYWADDSSCDEDCTLDTALTEGEAIDLEVTVTSPTEGTGQSYDVTFTVQSTPPDADESDNEATVTVEEGFHIPEESEGRNCSRCSSGGRPAALWLGLLAALWCPRRRGPSDRV